MDYPLQLDLDLDRDLGEEESFDVEDGETFSYRSKRADRELSETALTFVRE